MNNCIRGNIEIDWGEVYMGLFKKRLVGLDIDGIEIRAVEVSGSSKNPEITNMGKVHLPEGAVKEGKIENPEKVVEALEELWDRYKIKSKKVVFGANNSDVIVRFALFPKLPEEKLGNLIKFQASDYIPYTLDDVELDYSIISEVEKDEGSLYNVLLVAARKDMLYNFIKTLGSAHLAIKDIKSSALVMDRLIPEKHRNDTVVIVNICFDACNILIMDKNIPAFARTITFSSTVNDSLRTVYRGRSKVEQEQNGGNIMLMEEIDSIIQFIAGDIRSSIAYYQSQNRDSTIENVYLVGSAAGDRKMVEGLIDSVGTYMEVLKPYNHLYERLLKQYGGGKEATEYAIAFSLALHGLGG